MTSPEAPKIDKIGAAGAEKWILPSKSARPPLQIPQGGCQLASYFFAELVFGELASYFSATTYP